MSRDNHYDFVCDFNPAHTALGFTSSKLPPGWRLSTTMANDLRGNDVAQSFVICPICAHRLAVFALSIATPNSVAYPLLLPIAA